MEGLDLLEKLGRVKAPPDFEKNVLARLSQAKKKRGRQKAVYRFALAGSTALLVAFVLFNVFTVDRKGDMTRAGNAGLEVPFSDPIREAGLPGFIPVLETVDYSAEVRNASYEPRTVYILEQVSEGDPSGIKY